MNFKPYKTAALLLMIIPLLAFAKKEDYEASKHYEESYSISKGHGLNIEGSFASFEVVTWNKSEIKITGDVSISAKSQKKADEMVDDYEVQMSNSGTTVNLLVKLESKAKGWSNNSSDTDVRFVVNAPSWVNFESFISFGNLDIDELSSECDIDIEYGNLDANSLLSPNAEIEVSFGNAEIAKMAGGKLENSYGQVELEMLTGPMVLENSYGELRIGQMNSGANSIKIDNSFGEVSVVMPSSNSYDVTSESSFGSVKIKGDWNETHHDSDFQSEEKRGTLGSGSTVGTIEVENSFGEVSLKQD